MNLGSFDTKISRPVSRLTAGGMRTSYRIRPNTSGAAYPDSYWPDFVAPVEFDDPAFDDPAFDDLRTPGGIMTAQLVILAIMLVVAVASLFAM
jgi:hypothetical protein